jgi:hypothetical protein
MNRRSCVRVLVDESRVLTLSLRFVLCNGERLSPGLNISIPFHGHAPFQATPLEKHIIFTNKCHQRLLRPHPPETHELDILSPVKQQLKNLCNSVTKHSAHFILTCYLLLLLVVVVVVTAVVVVSNYYTIQNSRTNKNYSTSKILGAMLPLPLHTPVLLKSETSVVPDLSD